MKYEENGIRNQREKGRKGKTEKQKKWKQRFQKAFKESEGNRKKRKISIYHVPYDEFSMMNVIIVCECVSNVNNLKNLDTDKYCS